MGELIIRTNNQFRELLHFYELPEKVQTEKKSDYDTVSESMFFKYKGYYYDISDFQRFSSNAPMESPFPNMWQAYHNETFFSGILIALSDCGEMVKVGNYYS